MMNEQVQKLTAAGATVLIAEPVMQLAHFGGPGAIVGLGLGVAAYLAVDELQKANHGGVEKLPSSPSAQKEAPEKSEGTPSIVHRLLVGKSARTEEDALVECGDDLPLPNLFSTNDEDEQVPLPLPTKLIFSDMLQEYTALSLDRILLAYMPDGTPIQCRAKDLCHVALAGSTGGGKSSLLRQLILQLCAGGAKVLLLNPHYTRYDRESDPPEDWTPFTPFLVADPMECRKYEVIEHYMRYIAEDLLPKRLEKHANSQLVGKPYFLVIDEFPAIVAKIKQAPDYLAFILREGRKVGIYVITAAQDFLVDTIAPGGGGAIRDCYRTAYYVGGDGTTAKTLLDKPARLIPESQLGQGTVMLRNSKVMKESQLVRVPYVDNESLYRLLGPSTFKQEVISRKDDDMLIPYGSESETPIQLQTVTYKSGRKESRSVEERKAARESRFRITHIPSSPPVTTEEDQLHQAIRAYQDGAVTIDQLAAKLRVSVSRARLLKQQVIVAIEERK